MAMTVKEAIEALSQCHPDAKIFFSIDWQVEEGLVAVEHEIGWLRDKGDYTSPGRVYLHNNPSHFFNSDGTLVEDNFIPT